MNRRSFLGTAGAALAAGVAKPIPVVDVAHLPSYVIDVESYRTNAAHERMADRILAAAGYSKDDVSLIDVHGGRALLTVERLDGTFYHDVVGIEWSEPLA